LQIDNTKYDEYFAVGAFRDSAQHTTTGDIMKRNAAAVWQGDIKRGTGQISTESGAIKNAHYSFGTRFEKAKGTNPEELLAAAHAGCFSMALSLMLSNAGVTPERIDTTASVTIEPDGDGFTITGIHLEVHARIPGVDPAVFKTAADNAKTGCPVSKLFNAPITMETRLNA